METVDQLLQGMLSLLLRWDLSTSVFFFVCSMNQIPPHLFLSREDDDGIGDIRKTRFSFGSSSLCYLILVNF